MVLVTTICRQINGLSSSATHQDLSTGYLETGMDMPRIQAPGSVEVRGGGSALGQRQGVAMWQRSHCGETLLFNRLLGEGLPSLPLSSPSKHHLRLV